MRRYEEDTFTLTVDAAAAYELAHAEPFDGELPPSPAELADEPELLRRCDDEP